VPVRERSELLALARAQHGCVTAAQLAAAGVGRRAIGSSLATGGLRRIHRAIYVVGPVEAPHARAMAALLAVGPHAVLSHHTAAAHYALVSEPTAIDVSTTARGARPRQGVHVHHTSRLPHGDVRLYHRLPLTSPERTLVDLAATLSGNALQRLVEEAQVRRLVTRATLTAAVARHRDRPGVRALRAALSDHAPSLTRSEAERRLLELVRAAGLPAPRTNVRIGPYEVDFFWPDHRLVVEVDGYAFHSGRAAFERDRIRDADLQNRGLRVLRVTWHQLATAVPAVVARLATALA